MGLATVRFAWRNSDVIAFDESFVKRQVRIGGRFEKSRSKVDIRDGCLFLVASRCSLKGRGGAMCACFTGRDPKGA